MDRNKSSQSSIVKLVEKHSILTALSGAGLVQNEFHWSVKCVSSIYRKCEVALIWKTGKEVCVFTLYVIVCDVTEYDVKNKMHKILQIQRLQIKVSNKCKKQ